MIRRTQTLAEESQAETKRSRELNERLERLLEESNQELTQLRQEGSRLRAGLLAAQPNPAAISPAGQKTPDAATGKESASNQSETDQNLNSRLAELEDQVAINATRIKEQAQTKVESDTRFNVRLFGMVLANTYFNTGDSSENALPRVAPPPFSNSAPRRNNFGATLRQTRIGLDMTGPKVGGARLSANVDLDLFGGAEGNSQGSVLGALRLRTASARLDWDHTSFSVGQLGPLISPLTPTSLASVWYPALGESGNLWQWRPQIILERNFAISEQDSLVLQGGLMMPFGEKVNGQVLGGGPGYESRIAIQRQLDSDRRLELGAGGYFRRQPFRFGRSVTSYAIAADWTIPLRDRLELSGESFYGRAVDLGEESGGNIADVFTFSGPVDSPSTRIRGIGSAGGWTQLRAAATKKLEFNFAYGLVDMRNRDVFAGRFENDSRLRNQTASANFIYQLRSNFLLSLEYRRLWTNYPGGRTTNGHFNLAVGYAF